GQCVKQKLFKIALLIGAMIVIALGVSFLFPSPTPSPPRPLPTPNGYDTFMEAGALPATDRRDFAKMDQEALREMLDSYTNELQLLRTGLGQECVVPMRNYEPFVRGHFPGNDMVRFRRLGQLLDAEGRFAEMENRPENAAKSYLDAIHFGTEIPHGGALI